MKNLSFILLIIAFAACSAASKFRKDEAAFNSSAVIQSYRSVSDMNDDYFEIRENNFFEYYKQLFDSVKNTRYPGKYTMSGDTMLLSFYNKNGKKILGSKALANSKNKEIIFFDQFPNPKKRLVVN